MMRQLSFNNLINKEKNKIGFVIGLGPSLKPHLEIIKSLEKKSNIIIIGCNDIDLMTNISPNYWVHANSISTIERLYNRLNSKNAIIVYSDTVDLTPTDKVKKLLKVNYLSYDQRHFNNKKCNMAITYPCCDKIIKDRLTIQEELQKFCKIDRHYGTGDTVALHMLALSILLGCDEIYLTGIDLDYSKGYVNGSSHYDSFEPYVSNILKDFKTINESAKNINVNIFRLNKDSILSNIFLFKDFKYIDFLK